jgi:hypothetical protein
MLGDIALAAGDALALSLQAQEFVDIQAKIAPNQCMLQKLGPRRPRRNARRSGQTAGT